MAEVRLDGVSFVYPGGAHAVDDVSLSIADREFLVLVGPSGCGKTSTLRLLAGLEQATAGTIRIDNRIVNDVPPRDRDVAMVFQNYALYPHLTVYNNIAFGLLLRANAGWLRQAFRFFFNRSAFRAARETIRDIRRKVEETADLLDIRGLVNQRPHTLSGGERQRVALGRAMVRRPRVFLFDEPLSNLDAKLRVEMRAELKRLHRRLQTTTIYVTHDQEEALTLGDRVAVMVGGRLQQVAAPLDLYHRPANRFVAGFIGTPPMNFFEGRLAEENSSLFFEQEGIRFRLPQELAGGLSHQRGRDVVLGVRSECLTILPEGRSLAMGENGFGATVFLIEPLGDRVDYRLEAPNGVPLVCRTDPLGGIREGQRVTVAVNLQQASVFEPGPAGPNLALGRNGERSRG